MKTIKIKVYQFSELSEDAKTKVILEQIKFEVETMTEDSQFYEAALKMEKLQTPWFLGETLFHTPKYIEANEYYFTKDGQIFNISSYEN